MMHAFNQLVNKDNRLGLIVHLESSEILRAAQTYIGMLEALGRRSLFPEILNKAVYSIEREHPDLVHETEKTVSASQAINIVNHWLERVAVRDPALFMHLLRKISPREAAARKEKTSDA
jgi:type III secretory pathway component EscV